MSLKSIFRIVALLEGVSYILLLFIATPIKYTMNDPQYVKMLGMPHGLLFLAYISLAISLNSSLNWTKREYYVILLASIIPFGTFYIEKKILSSKNNGTN